MKNFDRLIIVLCLLIVLSCKCQSDLLNFGKKGVTNNPTPLPYSSPVTSYATPAPTLNTRLSPGTYRGTGVNTTFNKRGDFYLRIDSVDGADNVRAYFEASNGLQGNGTLSGKIDAGTMKISGALTNGDGISVWGTPSGDSIKCTYTIATGNKQFQDGNFTVYRR